MGNYTNTDYNSFTNGPMIPYKIMEFLATENETIWKILKYSTKDCLSKPNLSLEEKMNMIWSDEPKTQDYAVFLTDLVEDLEPVSKTILKIYNYHTVPTNRLKAVESYIFDILHGGKLAIIEYKGVPCNRAEVLKRELLNTLSGAFVGGVSPLWFDVGHSSLDKGYHNLGNNTTYTGFSFIMSVEVSTVESHYEGCNNGL